MFEMNCIGNLTRDVVMRTVNTRNGERKVANFSVAINEGAGTNATTYYVNVTAWQKLGEAAAKYLSKGSKVAVAGRPRASVYTTRDGEAAASLEVVASRVEFLSTKGVEAKAEAPVEAKAEPVVEAKVEEPKPKRTRKPKAEDMTDIDLPF